MTAFRYLWHQPKEVPFADLIAFEVHTPPDRTRERSDKDSIARHVLSMAAPAAITVLVQAAHQIVALYFVSTIVTDAIAGVSARVLPGLAISLAAAPIAGQNFGVGNYSRVRALFRTTGVLNNAVMIVVTMLVLWQPQALLHFFQDGYCACRNCDLVLTADVVDARSAGASVHMLIHVPGTG